VIDELLYFSIWLAWGAAIVLWLGALVHCLMNQRLTDIQRLTWVLVIIFLNVIGGALYFVIGRSPKRGD
jgi:hypothetical protein